MFLTGAWRLAVFAVVPVKRLDVSKRRLSSVLIPLERRSLALAMLEDVLTALKASVVDEIVIASEDSVIHEVAGRFGVSYFSTSAIGLNLTVEEATKWCVRKHADSVLVLPADIPMVTPKDINQIVDLGSARESVILSPSFNGGTNALFENPPKLISPRFGLNSFARHVHEACKKYVRLRFYCSVGTVIDIDSEDDLEKFIEIENFTRSRKVLEHIGYVPVKPNSQVTKENAKRR